MAWASLPRLRSADFKAVLEFEDGLQWRLRRWGQPCSGVFPIGRLLEPEVMELLELEAGKPLVDNLDLAFRMTYDVWQPISGSQKLNLLGECVWKVEKGRMSASLLAHCALFRRLVKANTSQQVGSFWIRFRNSHPAACVSLSKSSSLDSTLHYP